MGKTHDVEATRQYGTMIYRYLVDKAEKIDFPHARNGRIRLYEKSVSGKKGFPSRPSQDRRFEALVFFRPRGRSTLAEVIVIFVSDRVTEPCEYCWLFNSGFPLNF